MIYITQLIYIIEEAEQVFLEFENAVLPILKKYNGSLLLRLRPGNETIISSSIDAPYEVHLVSFSSDADLQGYMADDERKKYFHLKTASVKDSVLIKGERL